MQYTLKRPCPKCPFRTDIDGYLRGERAYEIAESLAYGSAFPCHETTVEDPDDESQNMPTDNSQMCAGAMILMEKQGQGTNQMVRIAERLGAHDAEKLDLDANVARNFEEFVRHHGGDVGGDTCEVCDGGCELPAGMLVGSMVLPTLTDGSVELTSCEDCGVQMCFSCAVDDRWCPSCASYHEEDEESEPPS